MAKKVSRVMTKGQRKLHTCVSQMSLSTMRSVEKALKALEDKLGEGVDPPESRTKDTYIFQSDIGTHNKYKYIKRKLDYDEKIDAKKKAKEESPSFKRGMDRLLGKGRGTGGI